MNYFFKISPKEADTMGSFLYELNKEFNPHVGEQKDGSFLVSEKMYELLKDREEFKRIDFSSKEKIGEEKSDAKKTDV